EEEQFVANNPPANVGAELILCEGRNGLTGSVEEKVVGVQHLVAQELISRTMKGVGARFGGEVDDPTRKTPPFRPEVVGLHFELLHGVLRRNYGNNVQIGTLHGGSIHVDCALTSLPPTDLEIPEGKGVSSDWIPARSVAI